MPQRKGAARKVPFFPNTSDNMQCAQATLLSTRLFFESQLHLTMPEVDAAICNPRGTGSWRIAGMLWMQQCGYEVRAIELFDYAQFAARGTAYIREHHGAEVAAWEEYYFDIPYEQQRARHFLQFAIPMPRIPELEDIRRFLDDGYLVQLTVNAKLLNGEKGYLGHAVLVIAYDTSGFILHDPGLPPRPSRHVTTAQLAAAWENGRPSAKNLVAYRRAVR